MENDLDEMLADMQTALEKHRKIFDEHARETDKLLEEMRKEKELRKQQKKEAAGAKGAKK
jgi:predicted secreted Zn-dependent protease